jgi:transcription elongation factor GreB
VDVCDDDGASRSYRIVGPDETDAKMAAISIDSPLATALLGKQVDDEVTITVGDTTTTVIIESIRYEA